MLKRLAISGYRSVRNLSMPLGHVTVLFGENGTGKTNVYHAVKLLQHAAAGTLSRAIGDEGGMPSITWAGQRGKGAMRVIVEVTLDELTYHLALGLPVATMATMFYLDPEVKEERLELPVPKRKRPLALMSRGVGSVTLRDEDQVEHTYPYALAVSESVLSQIHEPKRYPELHTLRETLLRWRFVHQFRTDPAAPARQEVVPVRTWRLADDGSALPCALRTIQENGDGRALAEVIDRAFPGCRLQIADLGGRLALSWEAPGLLRALSGRELSDGTLRFLCLAAVLLSPQPPPLLALNEPETSLHPSVLPALADLCVRAAQRCQLWITTHSEALAREMERATEAARLELTQHRLVKEGGATTLIEEEQ